MGKDRCDDQFISSLGNTDEWQEQRGLDMQFVGALMMLAEKFPDKLSGRLINEFVRELLTFTPQVKLGNNF